MTITAEAYVLESPNTPLVRRSLQIPGPGPAEAIVEVIACGFCHTDLGYADGSVPTKKGTPIVLGHEAVGTVVAAGGDYEALVGNTVLVPAVLPCGECPFCLAGRGNACPNQKMPGNDIDGGFSTHFLVPARPLITIAPGFSSNVAALSVVADAVSTAYQAVLRADLAAGDAAVIVGAGGVGGYVAQVAAALGARVLACDIMEERLKLIADYGAEATINLANVDAKELRKQVRSFTKGIPTLKLKIFECSGSDAGQITAYGLLERGSTLLQVGYTPKKIEVRLSNLMAFDATIHGTWGCPPEIYPGVLRLIEERKVKLEPFIDYGPMSRVNEYLAAMAAHKLEKRMVMDPRA
ncbi:MAG TPA: 6-hydroxycyclohex-1-ene-1-carbonyl-CoA dehydrogenase [Acidobacteriota bacterium]|nr:6-hydroxycyclohex-1-ene-1-carbonyl-CoA dehydrogenase [Acidobacteriota bacterium]